MRVCVRAAVREDILKICANPSDATVADIKAMGCGPVETLGVFALKVPEDDAVTFTIDERPICVFGWDKVGGVWYSWLITTPEMFETLAPTCRAARHLRQVADRNPTIDLMSILHRDDAVIERWMQCLGFGKLSERSMNLWRFVG